MAGTIRCTVVTPEKAIFDDDALQVVVPAHDGEVGILPGHARFLARLGVGELRIRTAEETEAMLIDGGFVQVANDRVTVLTDTACHLENIDLLEAEERVRKLRDTGDGEAFAKANHRLLTMKRVKDRFNRS